MPPITESQLLQVSYHAVNDVTRELARDGATLDYTQFDALDEPTISWLRNRLGLRIVTHSDHVELVPGEVVTTVREG